LKVPTGIFHASCALKLQAVYIVFYILYMLGPYWKNEMFKGLDWLLVVAIGVFGYCSFSLLLF
jgi:hypothetical protein